METITISKRDNNSYEITIHKDFTNSSITKDKEYLEGLIKYIQSIINDILAKIDQMSSDHRNGKEVDILSLTTLFLANQMDNSLGLSNDKESTMDKIDLLNLRKQVLNSIKDVYANQEKTCDDSYLDDFEFPDE